MNLLHLMAVVIVIGLASVPSLTALERLALDRAAAESVEIARATIREHFGRQK